LFIYQLHHRYGKTQPKKNKTVVSLQVYTIKKFSNTFSFSLFYSFSVHSKKILFPVQPFADPNTTKKKYTEIKYTTHLSSTIRSLLGSTLFGIGMTCVLHYYKGMIMGLAIQAIMGPFNLWENTLIRTILLRGSKVLYEPNTRIFDEKLSISELNTATDDVVDEHGSAIILRNTIGNSNSNSNSNGTTEASAVTTTTTTKSLEEVMLDTWDQGSNANLIELLALLSIDNINTQTKEDGWTSLMIVSGLKCEHDITAIRTMINEYKADVTIADNDGWTCLHWAAFHNNLAAATELYHHTSLLHVLDNEKKTPLDIAQQENNTGIIDLLQTVMNDTKKDK
jgi:Phosphate transport (Pho88)/Ankyrin repeats (3 copies)